MTKSGTNNFHGSLYEYHRPTLHGSQRLVQQTSRTECGITQRPWLVLRNTFGGTIGGPIKKDRLFFFAAYEGQRTADQLQTTRIIPTQSLAQGQLKYLCDPDGDANCVTGDNSPGNFSVASDPTFAPDLM